MRKLQYKQLLNWRDPQMPVIRDYIMRDGTRQTFVDADYEQRYRQHLITTADYPNWRNDPTYNLRRK
jgi:hypothetical protein